jgi:hypothetical protein
MLGLAAAFLTIAIPVQLGLHGITVGWAAEGVLFLALALRYESMLARVGALGVLALAVLRLLARHTPLHSDAFTPVFNAAFGTWMFVILALCAAVVVLRRADTGIALRAVLASAALLLLFVLLTMETESVFARMRIEALQRMDEAGAREAAFMGSVAVSVLWAMFATALLASGLAVRSRGLFYSAYVLFAITGAKVLVSDLAGQPLPYRILTFFALSVLLFVGAAVNLRFRERLSAKEAS